MKKCRSIVFFSVLLIAGYIVPPAAAEEQKADLAKKPIVYESDDFEILDGLEIISWHYNSKRLFQLKEGCPIGHAKSYFFGESARYDITFTYVEQTKLQGQSLVKVLINNREMGVINLSEPPSKSNRSYAIEEKTLSGIDIQQYSKITLEITSDNAERCRIEKMTLIPVGSFAGDIIDLKKPPASLRIFESIQEQSDAREMLGRFVDLNIKPVLEKRKAELAALKTPQQWKARQKKIRSRLHEFFGQFPQKTPLNAKIVGKLDRDKYVIEKLIFESQPKYYCTANFYVPKGRKFPLPGVLFTCGHSDNGKAQRLYHECCLGLVLKGYVVLALDPMGQGERSEYFDPATKENTVDIGVGQHHYIGRPSFLVDWTLSGLRTWDAIRAVDYLVSRPEVDKDKLAVVGNSGGGQMALLITAVDQRIKVCAAAHPGGSMENTYLPDSGHILADKEILSLIPPRPCRIIVGKESGEESNHRIKLDDMHLFYEGLGVEKSLGDMAIVAGVHDMAKPKREPTYEWFNRWFDKESEGKTEPPLQTEKEKDLLCTDSGFTLISLGGQTGQPLNAERAKQIYKPEKNITNLKQKVANRIGLTVPKSCGAPLLQPAGTFESQGFSTEKFLYQSEEGIQVPALLLKPNCPKFDKCIIIHTPDKGKPTKPDNNFIPITLVRKGYTVLSIDVRGTGETDPSLPVIMTKYSGHVPRQWVRDVLEIQSGIFNRTMLSMRTMDVIRAIDFISSRDDLKNKQVVIVGEGLGGLWSTLAAAYDPRAEKVVCVGTLPSYKLLVDNQYYNVWDYFWVPGALRDFDIPDLVRLVVPRKQLWVNPVNELAERLDKKKACSIIGKHKGLDIVTTEDVGCAIESFLMQ